MSSHQTYKFKIGSDPNNLNMFLQLNRRHADKRKHKVWAEYVSSSDESDASVQVKTSCKPKGASSDQDKHKLDPDTVFLCLTSPHNIQRI